MIDDTKGHAYRKGKWGKGQNGELYEEKTISSKDGLVGGMLCNGYYHSGSSRFSIDR